MVDRYFALMTRFKSLYDLRVFHFLQVGIKKDCSMKAIPFLDKRLSATFI